MQSHARLNTDRGARYMIQLAKHWAHRFEATYDGVSALIPLPLGTCSMLADPEGLDITIEAVDLEALARLEDVVAEHCCASPSASRSSGWAGRGPGRRAASTRPPCG